MKKIPTLFGRDWAGNPGRVLPEITPECAWVAAGEGEATRKLDGTCCLVKGGRLYRRLEVKPVGSQFGPTPMGFIEADHDLKTMKLVGWVPVSDLVSGDRWHVLAWKNQPGLADGTYELVGPKINGNPEHYPELALVRHDVETLGFPAVDIPPRDFDGLQAWLAAHDVEGIVWHHPDGRRAKIKGRDFGLKRGGHG